MANGTTIFKLRFSDHLNLSAPALANIAASAEELSKQGEILKFVFASENPRDLADPSNCPNAIDPEYVATAQARAWASEGGFYFENGQIYLKVKCRRALDLGYAYDYYRSLGLSTTAFPRERLDESEKSYLSVKSLRPLILTPSYQFGTIRKEAESDFFQALVADDWVAKDILIHCLPGVEIECPFYVVFNTFVIKFGAAGEDDQTSDLFYDAAADRILRSNGHIEVPKTNNEYFFLRRSNLLKAGQFRRFQDIRRELVYKKPDATCLFVTHDWERLDHPDPRNRQYEELIHLLNGGSLTFRAQHTEYGIGSRTFLIPRPLETDRVRPDTFEYIWYDYSCMPQEPRDPRDDALFREQLTNLSSIFASNIRTIQVGDKARQRRRSWCVMEQEIAKRNNGINIAFAAEEPNVGTSYDEVDGLFYHARRNLEGTHTTILEDARVVEWMLYRSLAEALTKREGPDR